MGVSWSDPPRPPAELRAALLGEIRQYANLHYGDPGWDVIAEAYTDAELSAAIGPRARTLRGALRKLRPVVAVWADREADALNSAF